jgi:aspartate/tyrosine/aromatic aminotransferase
MRFASTWADDVKAAPLDPILGMSQRFQQDTDPRKVNVSIGAYRTDEGKPLVLSCVRKAEQLVVADKSANKEYLPQRGDVVFNNLCAQMLFGEDSKLVQDGMVAVAQTLSGTGSLRLGAEFLKRYAPPGPVYISTPTWGTHNSIMEHAGLSTAAYRYWNGATRSLDFTGMLEDIKNAKPGSILLLHAAAHNPTGVDPTKAQWDELLGVCQAKNHICWFDSAYQGFASGDLNKDAYAIRKFASAGCNMLISQSFAKNFGLYGERIGTLAVVCSKKESVPAVMSQLDVLVRNLYSNPPKHGAAIVRTILSDKALTQEWHSELFAMSKRIQDMRTALYNELKRLGTPGTWTHITSQIGMFSYTGLTPKQSDAMVDKHHVYMLRNGRISMAGVTTKNVAYLAAAIDDCVRNIQ